MPRARTNAEIAERLELMGDLLELEGAVVYRVLAYRRAARSIRETPDSAARLSEQGRLTSLPAVGDTVAAKVAELLASGHIAALDKLEARNPPGIVPVMRINGVGSKTARRIFDDLGLATLDDVIAAARDGRVRELPGLGERTEQLILEGLAEGAPPPRPRVSAARLRPFAERVAGELRACPAVERCEIAGSLRRYADTAKDVDLVAAVNNRITAVEAFLGADWVAEVEFRGEAGASALAHDGTRVELRTTRPEMFGNLLQHLTGSRDHNVAVREAAVRAGLKVSELGIEDVDSGQVDITDDEREVYARLGMEWIPPELRENRGEIPAARKGTLPALVEEGMIRGDLHSHTDWSDGKATLERMVDAAIRRGLEYLCITDHSPAVGFGMGLDAGRLRAQVERVRGLAADLEPAFTLLVGCEVDILKDGSLDYSDELLADMDVVVASVHAGHRLGADDQTKRICAAMENSHVDILGHPTGRKIGLREPRPLHMDRVISTAVATGTVLEVSAQPDRLDLRDSHVRLAVDAGALLAIDTDAHSIEALDYMRFGVMNARRGWAPPAQVVNTRHWPELRRLLKP